MHWRTGRVLTLGLAVAGCDDAASPGGSGGATGGGASGGAMEQALEASSLDPGDVHCPHGGTEFRGEDGVWYACNGAPGPEGTPGRDGTNGRDGPSGRDGRDGTDGRDGPAGKDGVAVTSEILPPGAAECPFGGVALTSASGVTAICNGPPGAPVAVAALEPGDPECPFGGVALTSADDVAFVCHAPPGADGADGLDGESVAVAVLEPGDGNCPLGGAMFRAGEDFAFACHGAPGAKGDDGVSVISRAVGLGDEHCPWGGSELTAVNGVTYACNGAPGFAQDASPAEYPIVLSLRGEPIALFSHFDRLSSATEVVLELVPDGEGPGRLEPVAGLTDSSEITFQGGLGDDRALWDWREAAAGQGFENARGDVEIALRDDRGRALASWRSRAGWPASLQVSSEPRFGLRAVESLRIVVEDLRRTAVFGLPVPQLDPRVVLDGRPLPMPWARMDGPGSRNDLVAGVAPGPRGEPIVTQSPGVLSWHPVVLRRPLGPDPTPWTWREEVADPARDHGLTDVTLRVLDGPTVLARFTLERAWPASASVYVDPDGSFVEELVLVYRRVRRN